MYNLYYHSNTFSKICKAIISKLFNVRLLVNRPACVRINNIGKVNNMNTNNRKYPVLVTGASRGIGAAIAKAFAESGYPVYMCCRSHGKELEKSAANLSETYDISCHAFTCDVGDETAVKNMFNEMSKLHEGFPGIVINNAGVAHYGLLTDMSLDEWHSLMSTNLDSLFYICKNSVPYMLREGFGKIINISSVWGEVGASCEVAYSASKAGVIGLTKALAKEVGPSNIQVNCIAPGIVMTDMVSDYSMEELEDITKQIPLGRIGSTEDIAKVALFLASEDADYITGQVISPNGGWVI